MSERTEQQDPLLETNKSVDLSELQSLSFGPRWGDPKKNISSRRQTFSAAGSDSKQKKSPVKRDRRPKHKEFNRNPIPEVENAIEINIFPEDEPFKKLCQAIRKSFVTYELFEIAQAILQKDDRLVAVINYKKTDNQAPQKLYLSIPDKIPFLTETEAHAWFAKHHLSAFFDIEELEQEAPKGTFTSITRCKSTGELLGPPNYHRYQQLLQEHHATHLSHIPFDKFTTNLETEKSQEAIDEWLQKMTKTRKYKFKTNEGEEAQSFDSLESAKRYLLSKHPAKAIKVLDSIRMSGALIEKMPNSPLKQAIQHCIQYQRKFPLNTANNIRGRLRRMQFTIYKKGSKGISYVCAAKRKFRSKDTLFADSINKLITYIDSNPLINIADLRKAWSAEPETPKQDNVSKNPTPEVSSENKELVQMSTDLRWLLEEGFVVQYSDGRLFSNPIMEETPAEQKASASQAGTPLNIEKKSSEASHENAEPGDVENKAEAISND